MTIRVLVVEDHPVARGVVLRALDVTDGITTCGVARSGRRGIELAVRLEPDVVLMDVAGRGMSGIEATRQILRHRPHVRVIVVSEATRPEIVAAARAAGASGFVTKGTPGSDVVRAIRSVVAGRPSWQVARDGRPSWALRVGARRWVRARSPRGPGRRLRSNHG